MSCCVNTHVDPKKIKRLKGSKKHKVEAILEHFLGDFRDGFIASRGRCLERWFEVTTNPFHEL